MPPEGSDLVFDHRHNSDERNYAIKNPSQGVLAEAAIREAAQVRNHPRDLINPVVALNRAVAIAERDGPWLRDRLAQQRRATTARSAQPRLSSRSISCRMSCSVIGCRP
jgi:hypothetical protein